MFTLSLIFCLIADPTKCQTIYPGDATTQASQMACMTQAQQLAAQWVDDHPKWKLDHFSCAPGNTRKDQI